MEFIIRPATLEDAPALAQFTRDLNMFQRINAETPERTLERVQAHLRLIFADDSHTLMVAENTAGEIVGYLGMHWNVYLIQPAPEGYVSELFIREDMRGHGVGGALLAKAEELGRQRGCHRLLLLNIRTRESYQRSFYRKHGWVEWEDAAVFVFQEGER